MNSKFYVVSGDILPDYFPVVIEIRKMVEEQNMSVSAACEKMGICRSTYYKYKDRVFETNKTYGKKCVLSLKIVDQKGVLSHVLNEVYNFDANIMAFNATIPIKHTAYVTITIDASEMSGTLPELSRRIRAIPYVRSVSVVAYE